MAAEASGGEQGRAERGGWVGLVSLLAGVAVLIVYMMIRRGLDATTAARVFAALYFLAYAPGYVIQRFVFRIGAATPFESLVAALLLGVLVTPAIWYALCCAGLSSVFGPVMLAAGLALPVVWLGRLRGTSLTVPARQLVGRGETPVLWIAVGLAMLWGYAPDPVELQGGTVYMGTGHDHGGHTALIGELSRGTPPQCVPFCTGARQMGYHQMGNVWCDMMRRATGTDVLSAYFGFAVVLRYVFVLLACYLALVGRFGRLAATLGAACLLGAAGHPTSHSALNNGVMVYLPPSFPNGFGLLGAFLTVYYVAIAARREDPRAPLLLASILSALLLWYKANFALVLAPAVAVVALILLARRRDCRWLLLCWVVQAGLLGLRQYELSSADFTGTLLIRPLAFLDYLWGEFSGTRWDDVSARLSLPTRILAAVCHGVDALPAVLRWPAIFVLCTVKLFHVGLAILAYAVLRCGFARRGRRAHPVDLVIVFTLLCCGLGFLLFPVQEGLVWNVCFSLFALIHALLIALLGPALADAMRRLWRARRPVRRVAVTVAAAALLANAWALKARSLDHQHALVNGIDRDLYACFRYVGESTPRDAWILQPRLCETAILCGMVTQRRVVFEAGDIWQHFYDTGPIVADLTAFYAGTDDGAARRILREYGADYVVAHDDAPASGAYSSALTEVFRSGKAAVYRVDPAATDPPVRVADQPSGRRPVIGLTPDALTGCANTPATSAGHYAGSTVR